MHNEPSLLKFPDVAVGQDGSNEGSQVAEDDEEMEHGSRVVLTQAKDVQDVQRKDS